MMWPFRKVLSNDDRKLLQEIADMRPIIEELTKELADARWKKELNEGFKRARLIQYANRS